MKKGLQGFGEKNETVLLIRAEWKGQENEKSSKKEGKDQGSSRGGRKRGREDGKVVGEVTGIEEMKESHKLRRRSLTM